MPWQLSASAKKVPRVRIYLDDARLSLCLRPLQPAHSAGSLDTLSCAHKATAEQGEATRVALSLALSLDAPAVKGINPVTLAWMKFFPKTERFFEGMRFLFAWLEALRQVATAVCDPWAAAAHPALVPPKPFRSVGAAGTAGELHARRAARADPSREPSPGDGWVQLASGQPAAASAASSSSKSKNGAGKQRL